LVFEFCKIGFFILFQEEAGLGDERSGPDFEVWTGVPARPPEGGAQLKARLPRAKTPSGA
jgi:hypothetical protein